MSDRLASAKTSQTDIVLNLFILLGIYLTETEHVPHNE